MSYENKYDDAFEVLINKSKRQTRKKKGTVRARLSGWHGAGQRRNENKQARVAESLFTTVCCGHCGTTCNVLVEDD